MKKIQLIRRFLNLKGGDKHFLALALERPVVMTAAEYLEYAKTKE
jgi:hypothetical protein